MGAEARSGQRKLQAHLYPGQLLQPALFARRLQAEDLMRPVEPSAVWDELPRALRDAIESRTGPVLRTSAGGEGLGTSVRLVLHMAEGGVFIKGTGPGSTDHQRRRLALGADLAPYVAAVSPPLLWRMRAEGWDITAWPALPGRPWADQKPGSEDIPKMAGLLTKLSAIPAPDILTRSARGHWGEYADSPDLLEGDSIVHRDPNPTNFVVNGDRAWMVDFGWAVRGPAWMTSANLIVSMMEAGWDAADADNAMKTVPAWAEAPPQAVTELARAEVREWERVMEQGPVHEVWQFRAGIARKWAEYREQAA
jgi:hypothetical protein